MGGRLRPSDLCQGALAATADGLGGGPARGMMIAGLTCVTTAYQDRVGETVQHRYRLESLLGVGGFGAVYRATHVQMGTDLALKILHAEHCQDPRTVKRFELEAKRSAALKHPNTIRVFDFGATEAGEFFIAMEYLAGRSLASLIHREGPLAPERVVHILAQPQILRSTQDATPGLGYPPAQTKRTSLSIVHRPSFTVPSLPLPRESFLFHPFPINTRRAAARALHLSVPVYAASAEYAGG